MVALTRSVKWVGNDDNLNDHTERIYLLYKYA